jgi:hypothetical protein
VAALSWEIAAVSCEKTSDPYGSEMISYELMIFSCAPGFLSYETFLLSYETYPVSYETRAVSYEKSAFSYEMRSVSHGTKPFEGCPKVIQVNKTPTDTGTLPA